MDDDKHRHTGLAGNGRGDARLQMRAACTLAAAAAWCTSAQFRAVGPERNLFRSISAWRHAGRTTLESDRMTLNHKGSRILQLTPTGNKSGRRPRGRRLGSGACGTAADAALESASRPIIEVADRFARDAQAASSCVHQWGKASTLAAAVKEGKLGYPLRWRRAVDRPNCRRSRGRVYRIVLVVL
jgi:hypothetical protein